MGRSQIIGRAMVTGLATVALAALAIVALRTMLAQAAVNTVEAAPLASNSWAEGRLRQAVWLRPDLSESWRLLATRTSSEDAGAARQQQLNALRLDPEDWQNWRALGLLDYQLGRTADAEEDLNRAAQSSAGFVAHYEIANLAFLLDQQPRFWREMKAALRIAPTDDVQPALQDIVRLEGDHPESLVQILPPGRPEIASAAVGFLLQQNQLAAADALWRTLDCPQYLSRNCGQAAVGLVQAWLRTAQSAEGTESAEVRPVAPAHASASGQAVDRAQQVWNEAIRKSWLNGPTVQTSQITDADFQQVWLETGFGWHAASDQIRVSPAAAGMSGNAVRTQFSGSETSHRALLWQWLVVQPGRSYQIEYDSRGQDLSHPNGLHVQIALPAGQVVLGDVIAALGDSWSTNRGIFAVPPAVRLLRLTLAYDRPRGQELLQGQIWCRAFRLQPVGGS